MVKYEKERNEQLRKLFRLNCVTFKLKTKKKRSYYFANSACSFRLSQKGNIPNFFGGGVIKTKKSQKGSLFAVAWKPNSFPLRPIQI